VTTTTTTTNAPLNAMSMGSMSHDQNATNAFLQSQIPTQPLLGQPSSSNGGGPVMAKSAYSFDEESMTRMMRAVVMKILTEEEQDPGVVAKVMNLTAMIARQSQGGGTFDSGASNIMIRLDREFENELMNCGL
jgi:hypothetical protein